MGSTNGTFVNGQRIQAKKRHPLPSPSVIRVGRAVLVFQNNAKALLNPAPHERFGMAGNFHVGQLLQNLQQAAISGRHILLAGPSGAGKELCAHALASMMGTPNAPLPLIAHNAARFTSEEEAASTLFGIGPKVFSNVDSRPGLVEQAHSGALFLDEIHNLPERVQRSLLRVIEDGLRNRSIGYAASKR
ncbi:MAG: sigma-54-dependent Fis family transcriptional regulator [Proteobacteria bacterium]|nr:sigma-54-dependent Fis family transcriptional regulator [Pseudomonadota bacterium]